MIREKWRASEALLHFQEGAIPMVIGCVFAAAILLSQSSITDSRLLGLFIILAAFVWRARVPSWLVIPLAGLVNWCFDVFYQGVLVKL